MRGRRGQDDAMEAPLPQAEWVRGKGSFGRIWSWHDGGYVFYGLIRLVAATPTLAFGPSLLPFHATSNTTHHLCGTPAPPLTHHTAFHRLISSLILCQV